MAKKPLGLPKAPPGPQYAFFEALQALVIRADNLSSSQLAEVVNSSRNVVYRALVGPAIPHPELVRALVSALALRVKADPAEMVAKFDELWHLAIVDSRLAKLSAVPFAAPAHTEVPSTSAVSQTPPTTGADTPIPTSEEPSTSVSARRSTRGNNTDRPDSKRQQKPSTTRGIMISHRGPDTPYRRAFSTALVNLVNNSGMSVSAVAKKGSLGESSLDKWLHGERLPSAQNVTKFARVFNLDGKEIMELLHLHQAVQLEGIGDATDPLGESPP